MFTFVDGLGKVSKKLGFGLIIRALITDHKYSTKIIYYICISFYQTCLPHVAKDCEVTRLKRYVTNFVFSTM